jgi:hypothetical protein
VAIDSLPRAQPIATDRCNEAVSFHNYYGVVRD